MNETPSWHPPTDESGGAAPTETEDAIMRATYRALCAHGYADLTTERIAAELGKSTGTLHYYYDSKQELLAAFFDYLFRNLDAKLAAADHDGPRERLEFVVDALLSDPDEFGIAMIEMRAQVPYCASFRDPFRRNERRIRNLLADAVRAGVEEGQFTDVDADRVAERVMVVLDGARTRHTLLDAADASVDPLAAARESIDDLLDAIDGGEGR